MAKFKVLSAVKTGEYQSKFGMMDNITVALEDLSTGKQIGATTSQKPTSPMPSGEIEGDIEETKYGLKFHKAKPAFAGSGSGAPKNPREHAQEMALKYCGLQITLGSLKTLSKEALLPLIDWFAKDASGSTPNSAPVAPTSPPERSYTPTDTYQPNVSSGNEEIDINDINLEELPFS
jgi:hypothetical protein